MRANTGFDGYCLFLLVSFSFRLLPLDKDCILLYIYCVRHSTVTIRVTKETRDRLHTVKNPGQTLDGIITQLVDLWEKVKKQEAEEEKKVK